MQFIGTGNEATGQHIDLQIALVGGKIEDDPHIDSTVGLFFSYSCALSMEMERTISEGWMSFARYALR